MEELDNFTLGTGAILPRAALYPNNLVTFEVTLEHEVASSTTYYLAHTITGIILASYSRPEAITLAAESLSVLAIPELWTISDPCTLLGAIPEPLHCYLAYIQDLGPRTNPLSWSEFEVSSKHKRKLPRTRAPYLIQHGNLLHDMREIVLGEPIKHPKARHPVFYLRQVYNEYQVDHQPTGSRVARFVTRAVTREIIKYLYDYGLPHVYSSDRMKALAVYPGTFGAWLSSHRFADRVVPYEEWSK